MTLEESPSDAVTSDGRRARRERGRMALIDGRTLAEQLAVNPDPLAALKTYEDLRLATSDLYFERFAYLFEIPNIGEGTLPRRIADFVACQLRLYETNEPMGRLVRLRAPDHADVDEVLHRVRSTRADQIRQHFDLELSDLSPSAGDDIVAVIATLTSFESWDQQCRDHRRSSNQIRRAWTAALTRILNT